MGKIYPYRRSRRNWSNRRRPGWGRRPRHPSTWWRWFGRRNKILVILLVGFTAYWSLTSGVDEVRRIAAANAGDHSRCDIKGNINLRGKHIYHVPGGEYYGATRINPVRGERWFCSRWEALKAGWRPSLR